MEADATAAAEAQGAKHRSDLAVARLRAAEDRECADALRRELEEQLRDEVRLTTVR